MIHLRRADGRDWDGILHINPTLPEKGFLLIFNPLPEKITRTIELPLYFTGLSSIATISRRDSAPVQYILDRAYKVKLAVTIEPGGYEWFVIR